MLDPKVKNNLTHQIYSQNSGSRPREGFRLPSENEQRTSYQQDLDIVDVTPIEDENPTTTATPPKALAKVASQTYASQQEQSQSYRSYQQERNVDFSSAIKAQDVTDIYQRNSDAPFQEFHLGGQLDLEG